MFVAPIPLLMILFERYCALDAAIDDQIRRECHLIVNSWGNSHDKYRRHVWNEERRCNRSQPPFVFDVCS